MRMLLTHADLLLTIAKGDKGDPGPKGAVELAQIPDDWK